MGLTNVKTMDKDTRTSFERTDGVVLELSLKVKNNEARIAQLEKLLKELKDIVDKL
jgi:peptidoglycan hydrolase CwlO-like protein